MGRSTSSIPMLFIIAKYNDEEVAKYWYEIHENTLSRQDIGSIIELNGLHYLHRTHSFEIFDQIINFIDSEVNS